MKAEEIDRFLREAFPHRNPMRVEYADGKRVQLRIPYEVSQLRPGGTLSGPTMMDLADTAMYALVLSAIGFQPLAVTTQLSINFLSKPPPADLVAEARFLKLGRLLATGDVFIRSDGNPEPCAHAVVTYALPREKRE